MDLCGKKFGQKPLGFIGKFRVLFDYLNIDTHHFNPSQKRPWKSQARLTA